MSCGAEGRATGQAQRKRLLMSKSRVTPLSTRQPLHSHLPCVPPASCLLPARQTPHFPTFKTDYRESARSVLAHEKRIEKVQEKRINSDKRAGFVILSIIS